LGTAGTIPTIPDGLIGKSAWEGFWTAVVGLEIAVLEFATIELAAIVLADGTTGNVLRGGDKLGSFGIAGTIPVIPVALFGISGAVDGAACEDEAAKFEVDGFAGGIVVELPEEPVLAVALADEATDDPDPNALCKAPSALPDEGSDVGEAFSRDAATVATGLPLGSTKTILEESLGLSAARRTRDAGNDVSL
jgi:hypothetical protein